MTAAATPHSRQAVASSTRWSFVSMAGRQGSRVLFMYVLALILAPRDFGIASLAAAYIAIIGVLQDQGFGSALIQKRDMTRHDVGSVFAINSLAGLTLAGATFALAPRLADLLHVAELSAVLRVLTASVLLKALSVTPQSQLMRSMGFRRLAVADVASSLAGGCVGVVLAALGFRYWSLVALTVVTDAVYCAVTTVSCGRPAIAFRAQSLRGMWGYSRNAMAAQLLQYTSRNSDNLLVGRYLGIAPLGYYSLSYRLLMLPLQLIGQVAGRVAFPVLARAQDDQPRLRRIWLQGTRAVSLLGLPVAGLVAVSSHQLVDVVLGRQWAPAAVAVSILSLVAVLQLCQGLIGPLFLATGHANWEFRVAVVGVVTALTGFIVGLHWGIEGVAAGYLAASMLMFPLVYGLTNRLLGLRPRDHVVNLAPAAVSTAALAIVYAAVRALLVAAGWPEAAVFAVGVVAALAAYALSLRLVFRGALDDAVALGRDLLPARLRGKPAPEPASALAAPATDGHPLRLSD